MEDEKKGDAMRHHNITECPIEVRNECEAFKKGHTTHFRGRDHAPMSRILEGSTREGGSILDAIIRFHADCAFYKYHMADKSRIL
jgi:hypothetical protein